MPDDTPAAVAHETGWLVHKGGRGWYRPNAQGYTNNPAEAGRYSHADAVRHSQPNGPDGPRDDITIRHESEVPGVCPSAPSALADELERLMEKATPGPWHLCQHLKSVECDAACKCGYRGVVFGPDHDVAYAVMQPGHELPRREEEYGLEPATYPRPQQIADMHLAVWLRNHADQILTALRAERGDGLIGRIDHLEHDLALARRGWAYAQDQQLRLMTERNAVREALVKARTLIAEIDDYQKRPERGDYGVECACCMGELLDDDRQTIAEIDAALALTGEAP